MAAWAGYYGWLHAPFKRGTKDTNTYARSVIFGDTAYKPEPESDVIADHWIKCGKIKSGMNGPEPLEWTEISSYSAITKADLQPFEAECLRQMSIAYCNAYHSGQTDRADPPLEIPAEYMPAMIEAYENYFDR